MSRYLGLAVLAVVLAPCADVEAQILVRWSRDEIPAPAALGLSTVVLPAASTTAITHAVAQGYRVFLDVDAHAVKKLVLPPANLAGVLVTGTAPPSQLAELERRVDGRGGRVLVLDAGGTWPHIRSNWVTRNNEVLQVAGRSAQPWIENNGARFRMRRAGAAQTALTYRWTPPTIATLLQAPRVEDYLAAIAEAGTFGGALVLPLDEAFQADLLLGTPAARLEWARIRQHLDFYAWSLPERYRAVANIGVVADDPIASFEIMNLLVRHNLPFDLIPPARVPAADLSRLDLLVVLDRPAPDVLMDFARQGGTVVVADGAAAAGGRDAAPWGSEPAAAASDDRVVYDVGAGRVVEMRHAIANPDRFALDVRQLLGRERRVLDIWNGITVLASVFEAQDGDTVLVTALNYAHTALPVQLRVRGTYSIVHHESPEDPLALLGHTHRDGYTEFVLPALRTGARVFLSGRQRD